MSIDNDIYSALHGSSGTAEDENWVSVWKIFDLLQDDEFTSQLTVEELDFLEDLADYLRIEGKPPPLRLSSHVPCSGLFFIPDSISVEAPEGGKDCDYYGLRDFRLQEDILSLIDSGESDIWRLDICLGEESFGDTLAVVNRLTGLGVVKDDGGDLDLNYAGSTLEEFAPEKYMASNLSREIVRLIRSGVSDYDFLRGHFPNAPTYAFSTVLGKLLEDGTVIEQPDGELILGR